MRHTASYLKMALLLAAAVVVGGYAYLESQSVVKGPMITVESPENGATVDSSLVEVRGTTQNIAFISLNDRQIFVDEAGRFNEQLLLPYGYTIVTLKAKDKFGREVKKRLELVYK